MNTRRSVVAVVSLCSLFVAAWLLSDAAASVGPREAAKPHAEMALGADRIDWQPAGDYEQVVLTIAGPEGLWLRKEFEAGQPASLGLFDDNGQKLPDGTYTYELRPVSNQESRERPLVQSGHFSIKNGSFVTSPPKPPLRNITANLNDDDLVIDGFACIGDSCDTTTTDNDFPVLKLKGQNPNILFDDVEDPPSLAASEFNDWAIRINPSGAAQFSIFDVDGSLTPLSILAGAPDNSLFIRDNGNVGLSTATPAAPLHIYRGATDDAWIGLGPNPGSGPSMNVGYGGATFGRGAGFLNVRPDASATAPNPSLRFLTANVERMIITNTGNVGIGTTSPSQKLEIELNQDANTVALVENTNTGVNANAAWQTHSDVGFTSFITHGSGRTLTRFGLTLGGRGEILHTGGNGLVMGTLEADDIVIGTNNTNRLQISGSTGAVTISGNLTVNGTFSNPSSRALKEGFEPLDPRAVLDKFAQLPIQEWSYKSDDRKLRHVGPTVEDFQSSFGLGTEGQYIFPMDVQGVTMTAVQGLYQVVQEKDAEISALRQRLAALEELVAKLAAPQ